MNSTIATRFIDKEKVSDLSFPEKDLLTSEEKKILRLKNLQMACEYGNVAQHKVEITFEDAESKKKVETTIWEVTDEFVYLKHNVTIPVRRIWSVKF